MIKSLPKLITSLILSVLVMVAFSSTSNAQDTTAANIYFSEYIEGSGNNKALEIYNNSDTLVNLDNYQIAQSVNGGGWEFYHTFPDTAFIDSGGVYVLITNEVADTLFSADDADEVLEFPSVVHFNGNDARALIHIDTLNSDTTWIDIFGDPDNDPGDGWSVAGDTLATVEHTLRRKAMVEAGNDTLLASFGTNEEDSEWIVVEQNDFSNLGKPTETGVSNEPISNLPNRIKLSQNYPNPFNPSSKINFTLPKSAVVKLEVYNMVGQLVETLVNGRMSAGEHTVTFEAGNLASGVYLYRIQAGSFTQSKKMTLIK